MTAPRRVFVDTNVLIYASRPIEPVSRQASDALAQAEDAGDELCISRQILREYLSSVVQHAKGCLQPVIRRPGAK